MAELSLRSEVLGESCHYSNEQAFHYGLSNSHLGIDLAAVVRCV